MTRLRGFSFALAWLGIVGGLAFGSLPARAGNTTAFTVPAHALAGASELQRGPSGPDIVWDSFSHQPAAEGAPPSPPPPPPLPLQPCVKAAASPGAHIANDRAVFGGFLGVRAVSTGDAQDIGFAWDFYWGSATLYQGDGGRWFLQPPPGCAP